MSQILQAKANSPKAEQAIDQALAANPDLVDAHVQKGGLRQAQGDFTQALAEFNRALTLDAGNVSALLGRAQTRLSLGKLEEARQDVDAALRSQPDNPLARLFRRLPSWARRQISRRQSSGCSEFQGFEDYFPPALYLSGSLNFMVGNLERARESAEKYVSREPNSVPGKTLLAAIQLRQSEPQKAIDQLQPVVTAASEDFNAITLLATAYMMAKQPTKAAELYDRALKLTSGQRRRSSPAR